MGVRATRSVLATGVVAVAASLASAGAGAGGPLFLDQNGDRFVWGTTQPIAYRTDGGSLSSQVTGAEAELRVASMFDVWQDVPSASIRYQRAGGIQAVGGFSDGNVSTAAEYNAVEGDCGDGNQSPIIYDTDGSLFEDLGNDASVIGFAGPCAVNGAGLIVSGIAVMNGIFQDGVSNANNFELTEEEFDAAFIHEFGHFSGLDHSQINLDCLLQGCGNNALQGLPTMFPFLMSDEQRSLSTDDVAWISWLYPQGGTGGFDQTHGRISGIVYFSDGESHAQLVNVIARDVVNGNRIAASSVAGYRFSIIHGNALTGAQPSGAGSSNPAHIGLFEIPVPAGTYRIQVEGIHEDFTEGSSVGPGLVLPLPGTAPPPSAPITVTAAEHESGHDVVLIGTDPRYDDFEIDP
jgi:hypothetical protein